MKTPGPTDIQFAVERMLRAETPRERARVLIETFDLDDMDLGGWQLEDGIAELLECGLDEDTLQAEYDRGVAAGEEAANADFPEDAVAEVKKAKELLDEFDKSGALRAVLNEDLITEIDDIRRTVENALRLFDE